MKKIIEKSRRFLAAPLCVLLTFAAINSCNKSDTTTATAQTFTRVNLVANKSSYGATTVDANLVNGWGIAFSPTGNAWVSAADGGVTAVYDKNGTLILPDIPIPSPTGASGGAPTGQVFNSTTDFTITGGSPAKFIFAGEDGVISAWNTGGIALKIVDRSATSSYRGITIASSGGNNYLYLADFKGNKVDVFDKNFVLVSMPFVDATIPSGFAPFNIQNIGGVLYVTYAKVDVSTGDETKGAGLGYVDIYNPDGSLVKRYISQGSLNAPWGIAQAPAGFLTNQGSVILIGNFGDGTIHAFDASGNLIETLSANGAPIVVDGLWGISFAPATATTVDGTWLFFAAGPNDEADGEFGYIRP